MSKYAPLGDFLAAEGKDHIPMTFSQIEKVLRIPLPASKQYPAWWSNNPSNNPMTREWLDAGFETESVNIASEKLVFRRVRRVSGGDSGNSRTPDGSPRARHPGMGFMKGLIAFAPGFDPTKPFNDEPWDKGFLGGDDRT